MGLKEVDIYDDSFWNSEKEEQEVLDYWYDEALCNLDEDEKSEIWDDIDV